RPVPNRFLPTQLPAPFRVELRGHDPDGTGSGQPAFYRVRVLNGFDYETQTYLVDPDSLLREGAANDWSGWQQLPGDSASMEIGESFPPGMTGVAAVPPLDAG